VEDHMDMKFYGIYEIFLFPKGLNPFEIQTSFKVDLLLNFVTQNLERFGSWTKKVLNISISMTSLDNFEQQEDHVLYF
jgi:hypothetical protein